MPPTAAGIPANAEGSGAPACSLAEDAASLLQRGIAAAADGDSDTAIACFRQAVAERPGFAVAHANLGLLLMATNRAADAEPHLQAAVDAMPSDAVLANALGVALESQGRFDAAQSRYRAALAVQPDFVDAHANLGNCLRRLGRIDEAQAQYVRALELRPDFALGHYNLGVLLQALPDTARAITHYRRALELRPDYVEALNNLGRCLRSEGRVDEARAAFERVLELRPTQLEAHANLAQFKTYAPGDRQIDDLLSQRGRVPSLPGQGQSRYWFTVGKMLEDVRRVDESFAAYAEGNRLKHALAPWDETAHRDMQARIVAAFSRERMAADTVPASAEGPVPVFIVGMPRSGTSLIEQVLATLPGVHGAGEITWLSETFQSAAEDGAGEAFQFPESLADASGADLRRLGRRHVDRLRALAPQASHVVDKLPANFTHLGLIQRMLPGARIVHAMRDPLDACFSCFARLFGEDHLAFTYDLGTLGRYWARYDALMRHWHAVLPPGRILDVSYEAMVADFEPQARRLVAYLGLPWDERCLGFHANERVVKTASVAQVRRPIYRTSVARWKPFEAHLGPLVEAIGPRR